MGSEEDEPSRLYGLDEVCRGILVAIDTGFRIVRPVKSWRWDWAGQSW